MDPELLGQFIRDITFDRCQLVFDLVLNVAREVLGRIEQPGADRGA
jgi:hypothetical protein